MVEYNLPMGATLIEEEKKSVGFNLPAGATIAKDTDGFDLPEGAELMPAVPAPLVQPPQPDIRFEIAPEGIPEQPQTDDISPEFVNIGGALTPTSEGTPAFGATQGIPEGPPEFVKAAVSGLKQSSAGLVAGFEPSGFEPQNKIQKLAQSVGVLVGDLPAMIVGSIIGGGPASPITAAGGAFALPQAIRKVYMDRIESGEPILDKENPLKEFFNRFTGALGETLKGEALGVTVGAAAKFAPKGFKTISEVTALSTGGAALEGRAPTVEDFEDAALLIFGLKASAKGAKFLKNRYIELGQIPKDIFKDKAELDKIKAEFFGDIKVEEPKPVVEGKFPIRAPRSIFTEEAAQIRLKTKKAELDSIPEFKGDLGSPEAKARLKKLKEQIEFIAGGEKEPPRPVISEKAKLLPKITENPVEPVKPTPKTETKELPKVEEVKSEIETKPKTKDIVFKLIDESGGVSLEPIVNIPAGIRSKFEVPETQGKVYKEINKNVEQWRIRRNYGAFKAISVNEKIKKTLPELKDREAITHAIESPELQRGLTEKQKMVLTSVKQMYKDYETILKEEGILDVFQENYVNHIVLNSPKKGKLGGSSLGGRLGTRPKFTKQRVRKADKTTYTLKELEEMGYEVEKDISKLAASYQVVAEHAIANKRIVEALKTAKTEDGKPVLKSFSKIPFEEKGDYYLIDEMQLQKWGGRVLEEGEALKQRGKLQKEGDFVTTSKVPTGIHKDAHQLIDNILGDRKRPSPIYLTFARLRGNVKRLVMFNPLIHGWNIESNVIMALGTDYPRRFTFLKGKTLAQIEAIKIEAIMDGVELEGLFDIKGRLERDIYKLKIPEETTLRKMVTKPFSALKDAGDKLLWDKWIKSGQLVVYKTLKERFLGKGLSEAKAGRSAAMVTNDLLGTLPSTWFTKRQRKVLFNLMFARNWTVSNLRTLSGATGTFAKSRAFPKMLRFENVTDVELKAMSHEYRKVLVKGVIGAVVTANAIQAIFLKSQGQKFHPTWENEEDHKFDIDTGMIDSKGRKIFLKNWLFRQIDDYVKLLEGHPIQFAKAKSEPIMRTVVEILLNTDYRRQPIVEKGMGRVRAGKEIAKYFIKGITPLDNFVGRENEVRSWAEALIPLTGTWVRHGMPTRKSDPELANMLKGYYEYKQKKAILKKDARNKANVLIQQGKDSEARKLIDDVSFTGEQYENIKKSLQKPFLYRAAGETKFSKDFLEYLITLPADKKAEYRAAIVKAGMSKFLFGEKSFPSKSQFKFDVMETPKKKVDAMPSVTPGFTLPGKSVLEKTKTVLVNMIRALTGKPYQVEMPADKAVPMAETELEKWEAIQKGNSK